MKTIRCSSLDRLMKCPNSVLNPEELLEVETYVEAAELGTDIHAVLYDFKKAGSYSLDTIKQKYSEADYERACLLVQQGIRLWTQIEEELDLSEFETILEQQYCTTCLDYMLLGHADCVLIPKKLPGLSYDGETAYGIDYKTGRKHGNHYHQMAGYAFLVWCSLGSPKDFTIHWSAVYLEDLDIHRYTFTTESINRWLVELDERTKNPLYVLNDGCDHCTIQSTCPAYAAHLKSVSSVFRLTPSTFARKPTKARAEGIRRFHTAKVKTVELQKLLKDWVKRNGPLDTGDGRRYTLVETTSEQIDSRRAMPVLRKLLSDSELNDLIRIPLSRVVAAIVKKARVGQGAKKKRELMAALREAGAVYTTRTERLECRTIPQTQPDTLPESTGRG